MTKTKFAADITPVAPVVPRGGLETLKGGEGVGGGGMRVGTIGSDGQAIVVPGKPLSAATNPFLDSILAKGHKVGDLFCEIACILFFSKNFVTIVRIYAILLLKNTKVIQ